MIRFSSFARLGGIEHGITEVGDTVPVAVVSTQVHKDKAVWVSTVPKQPLRGADALLCKTPDITIGVHAADCVPLLLAEPKRRIVGAIHAGWRGTALEIARKTIDGLKFRPNGIMAGIGPAICPKCFVVGPEVAMQFDPEFRRETADGQFTVDLWAANTAQLIAAGVLERNIEVIRRCTLEDSQLYSFRRGDRDKPNLAWIRLAEK